ncbi:MAG TPA: serine/threonine-protein kinase [Kofleriaceae bacterium]|nr:serine/threonine-protein kinase [Kofleriaceae bacterium]
MRDADDDRTEVRMDFAADVELASANTSIGPYRVLRRIGEGGMGAVYLAEHTLLGRRAAIKLLHPAMSRDRDMVARFFNEARATSSIADPGIVQIYDFGLTLEGEAYIVMELLDGESVEQRVHRQGRLGAAESLRIVRQVAGSLAATHARNIVHRDLKPDNIFLVTDGEAPGGERTKILDFGVCKLLDDAGDIHTQVGIFVGAPSYTSPEGCRGIPVDHRADIYSLGCALFYMLVGKPPFDAEDACDVIDGHLREPAPAPSAVEPGLPAGIDELVVRCLAKSPDERFQTMAELKAACEALLARLTGDGMGRVVAPLPVYETIIVERDARAPGRARWALAGLAVLALAGLGFAVSRLPSGAERSRPTAALATPPRPIVEPIPLAQVRAPEAPPPAPVAAPEPPPAPPAPAHRPTPTNHEDLYDYR